MHLRILGGLLTFLCLHTVSLAQLAPAPPADQPVEIQVERAAAIDAAIAPYVAEARKTYPAAKSRFLQRLPPGQIFFVTAQLRDANGRSERVFVRVAEIRGAVLSGTIASQIMLVDGFKTGQNYSVNEADILDWLIAKPDGSEEGNFVGKFLDSYRP